MKLKSMLLTAVLLVCGFSALSVNAKDARHFIEGTVHYSGSGPIYLYLVDQEGFDTPLSGVQTVVLEPESHRNREGAALFRFEEVPSGRYGIRAFQDSNGNGKLDKGMFGPSEPWGMSWNRDRVSRRWPCFEDIVFTVDRDVRQRVIRLK